MAELQVKINISHLVETAASTYMSKQNGLHKYVPDMFPYKRGYLLRLECLLFRGAPSGS